MNKVIDTFGDRTNVLDPVLSVVYENVGGGYTTQQIIRKIRSDCDRCFNRQDIKKALKRFQDTNTLEDGNCFAFLATHVAGSNRILIKATYQAPTEDSKQHTFLIDDVVYDNNEVWPERTLVAYKCI